MMLKQELALLASLGFIGATIPSAPTTTTFVTPSAITNGFTLFPTSTPVTTSTAVPTTPVTTSTAVPTSTTLVPSTATVTSCPTSHHHSSCHHSSRHHSSRHHHSKCHSKHHSKCHTEHKHHSKCHTEHKPCCETKTVTTHIDHKPCCLFVYPCPTNPTSYVTSTSMVAPTSQAVVPACTPCTSYVYETVRPSVVCTTMIFCDIADQSENCKLQNERHIEDIANLALRDGGRVFVNGQLVVFERRNNTVSRNSNGNISGQESNDSPALVATGSKVASGLGVIIAAFMLA